ncbi:unnamed protein product, partial [Amoebophrya sp. A25]
GGNEQIGSFQHPQMDFEFATCNGAFSGSGENMQPLYAPSGSTTYGETVASTTEAQHIPDSNNVGAANRVDFDTAPSLNPDAISSVAPQHSATSSNASREENDGFRTLTSSSVMETEENHILRQDDQVELENDAAPQEEFPPAAKRQRVEQEAASVSVVNKADAQSVFELPTCFPRPSLPANADVHNASAQHEVLSSSSIPQLPSSSSSSTSSSTSIMEALPTVVPATRPTSTTGSEMPVPPVPTSTNDTFKRKSVPLTGYGRPSTIVVKKTAVPKSSALAAVEVVEDSSSILSEDVEQKMDVEKMTPFVVEDSSSIFSYQDKMMLNPFNEAPSLFSDSGLGG